MLSLPFTSEELSPKLQVQADSPVLDGRAERSEPSKASAPVVLLATTSHLPSTAKLAVALARSGYKVASISPPGHPLRMADAVSLRLSYSAFRPLRALEAALEAVSPDLVIPCDERTVRHMHRLHAAAARSSTRVLIERSLGSPRGYGVAETRHDLLMLARQESVRVPATRAIRRIADLHAWHTEKPFPWVLKADGSWAGQGVRIVSSLAEAEEGFHVVSRPPSGWFAMRQMVLEQDSFWLQPWLARSRPAVSVQQYIEGRPANCGIACWAGEVLAGISVEAVNTWSQTGPSSVVRLIDHPEMLHSASRVVRALGMTGLVGFDFMIEATTGAAFMIEMNPRSTPICHIPMGPGRDLLEALYARLSGGPMRDRPPATLQDIIAFFPDTWRQNATSPFLHSGYLDVPWEEPRLVRELMKQDLRDRYWVTRQMRRLWWMIRPPVAPPCTTPVHHPCRAPDSRQFSPGPQALLSEGPARL